MPRGFVIFVLPSTKRESKKANGGEIPLLAREKQREPEKREKNEGKPVKREGEREGERKEDGTGQRVREKRVVQRGPGATNGIVERRLEREKIARWKK